MTDWIDNEVVFRKDINCYIIQYNGLPYCVNPSMEMFTKISAWASAHPDKVKMEEIPGPTETELLAEAKTVKTAEFDRAMADIDAELIRSTSDLVAAMLSPATLTADEDGTSAIHAEALEKSKLIFVTLRQVQAQNRALRGQMEAAQTVEAGQAIEPIRPDMAALAAAF